MKIKILMVTLVILAGFDFGFGQEFGSIHGVVRDISGQPLPRVQIQIQNTTLGTISDENGGFEITSVPSGTYTIVIGHIGYEPITLTQVDVESGRTTNLSPIWLNATVLTGSDYVISATRGRVYRFDTSRAVNRVNPMSIRQRESKTSAEALREEPGVFVQKTHHGGGSAIIRGLSSNQILLLVDGVRLNNSTYRLGNHQYLTTVDNQIVDRLEVLRGPGSVLYGSDALGGTVQLLTSTPEYSQIGKVATGISLMGRMATADDERTIHARATVSGKNFAFLIAGSDKKFGDLKRGENSSHPELEHSTDGAVQKPTAYDGMDTFVKGVYQPHLNHRLTACLQTSSQGDVPRYDKYENDDYHLWLYRPQRRALLYLTYEMFQSAGFFNSLQTTVSWHQQKEGRLTQKNPDSRITAENDEVETLGWTLQSQHPWRRHRVTWGIEVYTDDVTSERIVSQPTDDFPIYTNPEYDVRGRYPDGSTYISTGLFLQDEIELNSVWLINLGSRYSWFETEFNIVEDPQIGRVKTDFQSLTGSLGITYKYCQNLRLLANIGQAFRAPNLSDLTKLGESKGSIYEVPNPNLEPEKMISIDGGFRWENPAVSLETMIYYSPISNLLASVETTYQGSPTISINDEEFTVKMKDNVGKAYLTGFEIAATVDIFPTLAGYGNLTYTYGQNTTLDEPIGGVPPLFGTAGLRWETEKLMVNSFTRLAVKQDRLSADDLDDPRIPPGGTPGWWTLNCRTETVINDWLTLQLSLENIFDLNYREHGSGVNGPGRNFIVSLQTTRLW